MLAPGTLLQDRYRVVKLLERDTLSSTYEAIDQRFAAPVSLKEWYPDGAEASRRAFGREARLLNSLFHVAIPYVFDTFSDHGAMYLVKQRIPGLNVDEIVGMRGTPFAIDDVLEWADRILDLLDYLHTREPAIIHNNINPKTLTLTPRGDILVTDFSLATEGSDRPPGYTLPYAPYEQIQGLGVGPESDVYSLGATIYYLLTLRKPANAYERFLEQDANLVPTLTEVDSAIPSSVSSLINAMMEVRPENRPASAAYLRAEFQRTFLSMRDTTIVPTDDEETADLGDDSSEPTADLSETDEPTSDLSKEEDVEIGEAVDSTTDLTVPDEPAVDVEPTTRVSPSRTNPICQNCGSTNEPDRIFCPYCGTGLLAVASQASVATIRDPLPANLRLSHNSGAVEASRFTNLCPLCGAGNLPEAQQCRMCAQVLDPTERLDKSESPADTSGIGAAGTSEIERNTPETVKVLPQGETVPLGPQHLEGVAALGMADTLDTTSAPLSDDDPTVDLSDSPLAESFSFPESPATAQLTVLEGEESGRVLRLRQDETVIGRSEGDYTFPLDIYMSGAHARIVQSGDEFVIIDNNSRNGTFVRVVGERRLDDRDAFLAGRHLFRLHLDEGTPRIEVQNARGQPDLVFTITKPVTLIGRKQSDIEFEYDDTLADRHAEVVWRDDGYYLVDQGSKNGTYLKIADRALLESGMIVILGGHIFRFEAR